MKCRRPPAGWRCTRAWDHAGPCAARIVFPWESAPFMFAVGFFLGALAMLAATKATS